MDLVQDTLLILSLQIKLFTLMMSRCQVGTGKKNILNYDTFKNKRYEDANQATSEQGCLHANFVEGETSRSSQTFNEDFGGTMTKSEKAYYLFSKSILPFWKKVGTNNFSCNIFQILRLLGKITHKYWSEDSRLIPKATVQIVILTLCPHVNICYYISSVNIQMLNVQFIVWFIC